MRLINRRSLLAAAALSAAALAVPGSALATGGTATITGGTLAMTAPATVGFSATLTGAAQNVTAAQAVDVLDNTGTGNGWNVTLTSTTFTSGSNTLDNASTTDTAASGACDTVSACTLATSAPTYPITVPAGTTAPTAVKLFNAAANTGMAGQTWTNTMSLALPASVHAGSYTSTWTYSLVSAP